MEDKCPRCGAFLENGVCPYCGYIADGSAQENTDSKKVTELKPEVQQTGNQNAQPAPAAPVSQTTIYVRPVSPKSKIVALLLCFFFGVFGVHRFYAGKVVSGIVYLLTVGIAGVGVIYDLIMIIIGHFTDSNGLPLTE